MPTQEERLGTVEFNLHQFKTETVKVYGDMAFEMTIIKGLTQDNVTKLAILNNTVEKRFGQTDIRLDGVDAHLEGVDAHLDGIDTRLGHLETATSTIQTTLTQILERLPEKP